jgi:hypothetical protein
LEVEAGTALTRCKKNPNNKKTTMRMMFDIYYETKTTDQDEYQKSK